jgi:hypothetical protein
MTFFSYTFFDADKAMDTDCDPSEEQLIHPTKKEKYCCMTT